MAASEPDIGTGTTLTFSSSFFGEIVNLGWTGIERGAIDFTHLGSTVAREFKPTDLYDPGELAVEVHFDSNTFPPMSTTAETVTVTFPGGGTTDTWACAGFLTSFGQGTPLEDKMTANGTIKFTGAITVA